MQTTLNTNYTKRVEIKATIKALKSDYKTLVTDALKELDKLIKEQELNNVNFALLTNKKKADYIASYIIDNKDGLVRTVCLYKSHGLTIHYNVSESFLNDCFKLFRHGLLSKTSFKNIEKLRENKKEAMLQFNQLSKDDKANIRLF